MDSLTSTLNKARGRDNVIGGRGMEATPKPATQHLETQPRVMQNKATRSTDQLRPVHKDNNAASQQQSMGQRKALPTGRPTYATQDNNGAPLDSNPSSLEKPAFTRGISVIDQTAVTSTAPTPAGEIQNPMSFGMGQPVARQRESHLPDEDLREKVRAMSRSEPLDDVEGNDDFGEDLSRQETEKAR